MLLLTEVLAKQAWQVVQTIGDPDFINQKIVEFAEPASETSLEAQTISPDELERLKSLDTAALGTQAAEAMQARAAPVDQFASSPSQPAHSAMTASATQPRTASGDLSQSHPPAAKRAASAQTAYQAHPEAISRQTSSPVLPSGFAGASTDPRASYSTASRAPGSSKPQLPRITPPRKSTSSGPLSALGGFATGALGALADAAERAVDVVGGTVDEFGNLLMVPAESSSRNQNGGGIGSASNGATSPRRRYALLAEREQDEFNNGRAPQQRSASGRSQNGHVPAYHLDMPSSIDEPPLPASLRQSMRSNAPQQHNTQSANETRGFDIPDTPERRSMDTPSIVAPAPVAAALNFASRDSFSIDEGQEDEEASQAAMQHLLSDRASPAYEAFENFLEQPNNRFCAPNEGESLLRLHTQLNTLASIMEFATLDEQTFRADASTILSKALEQLPSTLPPTHDGSRPVLVRRSAQQVLTNLEWCANMDVVEPLRENIIARLVQLHNAYLGTNGQGGQTSQPQSAQTSPNKSRFSATLPGTDSPEPNQLSAFLDRENRPSFSGTDAERNAFRYEPRRKGTGPNAGVMTLQPGMQTPPRAPSVPPQAGQGGAPVMGPPTGPSRPMSVPPRVPSAPPRAQQMVLPGAAAAQAASSSVEPALKRSSTDLPTPRAPGRTSLEAASRSAATASTVIDITDISSNAESSKAVDLRTFEVMISVEGITDSSDAASVTSPDGFVLVRRWHEFEQMDAEVQRQPRSQYPLPRLPVVKGRRSAEVCSLLESYLFELLLPANRAQLAGVAGARRFFDRTRAGASAEDLRRKGVQVRSWAGLERGL